MAGVNNRDVQKIEIVKKLLNEKIDGESAYFSFIDLAKESSLLNSQIGVEKIFQLIQQMSGGEISFKPRIGRYNLPIRAGQPGPYPEQSDPVTIGIDVHVSDPDKLEEYFDHVLEGINKAAENSEARQSEKATKQLIDTFELTVKDNKIRINNYLISKPHAVGNNFEFFDYVRLQPPNTKIEWNKIPDKIGWSTMKENIKGRRFIRLLGDLGFKSEIKKAFFYKVDADSLFYRGDKIDMDILKKAGVKSDLFVKELEVAHLKNVPDSTV